MSRPIRATAVALFLALAAPAHAQVSSAPLAQVDAWGVGWLRSNEGPLPTGIWANTTGDVLAPLYASIQPQQLSPAGRAALRRIALSSAKAPADGAALLPERLRIIEQLGEIDRSIDLRKRFASTSWGKSHERLASEYELVQGQSQSACARVADKRGDDNDWMPVRAFCLALAKDFNGATLVGEHLPAGADGKTDPWLLAAISAMDPAVKARPEGRYANAFEAAVSIAAKLSVPVNGFVATPGDVAAAVVQHPGATLEQKRAALRPALDAGKIKPLDVLTTLTAKDETPSKAAARTAAPKTDFLAMALAAFANAEAKPEARSAAYAAALKSADTPSDFRLAAAGLSEAIKALPKNETNAETFSRAALSLGDTKQASDWRKAMDEKSDPWAAARIDLMLSYTGPAAKPGEILDRLVAALPPTIDLTAAKSAKPIPPTPQSRQTDLRRIENTRALFLFTGTGRALTPDQRALLGSQKSAGRGVSDAAIARISSAADQDADGEAMLASIALLGPDTSALSFAGLSDILIQLRRIGLDKDADAIALESLQVWKAL